MLRYASNLPDNYEYAIVFWGQSNSRAWGAENEAFDVFAELELEDAGANLVIPAGTFGALTTATSRVPVISGSHGLQSVTITADVWKDAKIYLGETEDPRLGYGTVTDSVAEVLPGTGVGTITTDDEVLSLAHTVQPNDVLRLEIPSNGLPQTLSLTTTASDIDNANNEFDLGSETHGLVTGDRVTVASSGTFPTTTPQIDAETILFVRRVDDNEFDVWVDVNQTVQVTLDAADGDTLTWSYHTGWMNGSRIDWGTSPNSTITAAEVDVASNEIDLGGVTHGLLSGDRIRFTTTGDNTNDWPTTSPQIGPGTTIYVKRIDANEFQMCTDATLETVITISSDTDMSTLFVRFEEIQDGGHYVAHGDTVDNNIALTAAYGGTRMQWETEGGNKAIWQISRIPYLEVDWTQNGETAIAAGTDTGPRADSAWVVHEEEKWKSHKSVRVLTPWVPEQAEALRTEAPQLPGGASNTAYTVPSTITSHEDFGLFLNYTWVEGVDGSGAAGATTNPTATTLTIQAGTRIDDILIGGHCRLDVFDSAGAIVRRVYGDVTDSAKDAGAAVTNTNFSTTTNRVTLTAHGMVTGQRFYLSQPTAAATFPTATGVTIDANKALYCIVEDANTFRIATSYKLAVLGTSIDITAQPSANVNLHSTTVVTLSGGWTPAGDPTTGGSTYHVQIFRDHWLNNPYAKTAGPGFMHPNNETMPFAFSSFVQIHDVPLGSESSDTGTDYGYSNSRFRELTRIGAALPMGWKIGNALGKRINLIHLGINSAGIYEQPGRNVQSNQEEIGWWDPDRYLDWTPSRSDGSAARLEKMIRTMAPAALTAEGNTKPLRILGIVGAQGEAESITKKPRDNYKNALPMFYRWLTGVIHDAGLSYYDKADKMPICHWDLPSNPWELDAASVAAIYGLSVSEVSSDTNGIVNKAIANLAAKREFASTIDTEDSPKLANVFLGTDPLHYNGEGFVINGVAAADALIEVIDKAVSSEDDLNDKEAIEICNMALSYVGDVAKITSLDTTVDTSAQAKVCARFYAPAREILLQQMAWSFATRRESLSKITDPRTDEWAYAYGLPDNSVRVFAILPPEAGGDYNSETGDPKPFTVEQDTDGYRIIYTDQDDAVARFNTRVNDASQFSPTFKNALALKLGAMMTGTLVRGTEGVQMRVALEEQLRMELEKAKEHDAVQHTFIKNYVPRGARARH